MLAYDPKARPSLEEIRAHPWMQMKSVSTAVIQQQLVDLVKETQEHERESKLKQSQANALMQQKQQPHQRMASKASM